MELQAILLVEDNPDHILLIEETLDENGMGKITHVVKDGKEALDFLYNRNQFEDKASFPRPDLILLDLKLPKLNGLEVLKEVKSDRVLRQIPVVVVSSSLNQDDVTAAYENGVNSYIGKPINFVEFSDKVKQMKRYWFKTNTLPTANTVL